MTLPQKDDKIRTRYSFSVDGRSIPKNEYTVNQVLIEGNVSIDGKIYIGPIVDINITVFGWFIPYDNKYCVLEEQLEFVF